ncbi:hypothetical protein [Embleya sp. MST-111070]|uniref:hypothetical protein n=1 Tax=Embleya sp. MST-111070 TaxID=3398231 RepID=UPI003F737851
MTVTRQQPPTEADLRLRMAGGEVRVRDARSRYVGTLYRVACGHVVALTANSQATYTIPLAHLEVVDDEAGSPGLTAPEPAKPEAARPGRIVAAQPLVDEPSRTKAQHLFRDGSITWRMPPDGMDPSRPPTP